MMQPIPRSRVFFVQRTMSGRVLQSDKQVQLKKLLRNNIDYRALKRCVGWWSNGSRFTGGGSRPPPLGEVFWLFFPPSFVIFFSCFTSREEVRLTLRSCLHPVRDCSLFRAMPPTPECASLSFPCPGLLCRELKERQEEVAEVEKEISQTDSEDFRG